MPLRGRRDSPYVGVDHDRQKPHLRTERPRRVTTHHLPARSGARHQGPGSCRELTALGRHLHGQGQQPRSAGTGLPLCGSEGVIPSLSTVCHRSSSEIPALSYTGSAQVSSEGMPHQEISLAAYFCKHLRHWGSL